MGPKKKANAKGKGKGSKEEVKAPAKKDEEEPMPDYDWLPKKRKPKEHEGAQEPQDDKLWIWPGDRQGKPIHSETFWASGRPPTPPGKEKPARRALKETDKGYCFLKNGPFVKPRPPSRCAEHGVVKQPEDPSSPKSDEKGRKGWCHENCDQLEQEKVADCPQHGNVHTTIYVKVAP
jgi:hypothetical protein